MQRETKQRNSRERKGGERECRGILEREREERERAYGARGFDGGYVIEVRCVVGMARMGVRG